ncbi:hypothetical protein [Pseudonocardia sp.]|uniref:hypothetical protein n=1 Tax=Pseudonocardia sp. TaxID=60912 RepID=UPI003D14DB2D
MIRRIVTDTTLVLAVGAAVAACGGVAGSVVLTGSGVPLQAFSAPCAVAPGAGGDVASASAPGACAVAGASAPVGAGSPPVADSSAPVARAGAPGCATATAGATTGIAC